MRIYLSLVFGLIRERCFVLTCSIKVPIYPHYHCCCCSKLAEETFWYPNMLSLVSFAESAVLWIGTLTGGAVQGESPPVLVKESYIQSLPFTSRTNLRHWKMCLFLLCIKLINEYISKPKCNCRRKSMQDKEPIMVVWCKLKVQSLRITVWHHSAMLNSYRRDRIFNPQLTAIENSYNKVNV